MSSSGRQQQHKQQQREQQQQHEHRPHLRIFERHHAVVAPTGDPRGRRRSEGHLALAAAGGLAELGAVTSAHGDDRNSHI